MKTLFAAIAVGVAVFALCVQGSLAADAKELPKEMSIDLGGGMKMEFVLIRSGSFQVGSEGGSSDEKPVHRVTITKPFYMGKYEVTQEQWQKVMGSNPSKFKGAKNPVEEVSWDDCQKFLKKLSELKKGSGTFRLPTEAEWEYACRAGSTTAFCYGDDEGGLKDYAWYSGNSGSKTQPVGDRRPNAWGLYDMHGNVWEWCSDWYDSYKDEEQKDPTGPAGGQYRVLRGGSWARYASRCRSACRVSFAPDLRDDDVGLRVVCVAGESGNIDDAVKIIQGAEAKKGTGGKMTETQKQVEALLATKGSNFLTIETKRKPDFLVQVAREEAGGKSSVKVLVNYPFTESADNSLGKAGITVPAGWQQIEFEEGTHVTYNATGSDAKTIAVFVDDIFGKLFQSPPDSFGIEKM